MRNLLGWLAFAVAAAVGFWLIRATARRPPEQSAAIAPTVALQGRTMGSTYSIRYVSAATPPRDAEQPLSPVEVQSAIEAQLRALDGQISTWNPDSELSRFNASRTTDWFDVAPETVELIAETKELTALSRGKFDVTLGALTQLWGFGPAGRIEARPNAAAIDAAKAHVGIDKLQLRTEPPAIRKSDPLLAVDLSSVGAGKAADRVSALLDQFGLSNHFVDIAGEIVTRGKRADGSAWRIGVERPQEGRGETLGMLQLENAAVATSGNYRNYQELDGRRVGHTLDAVTGQPAQSDVLSATVIADSCSRADGLATMLMTLPADEARALADAHRWRVLLVVATAGAEELRVSSELESAKIFQPRSPAD
ncbi:MAG: FAD:protein FMN transferase [Aureliella sp.]